MGPEAPGAPKRWPPPCCSASFLASWGRGPEWGSALTSLGSHPGGPAPCPGGPSCPRPQLWRVNLERFEGSRQRWLLPARLHFPSVPIQRPCLPLPLPGLWDASAWPRGEEAPASHGAGRHCCGQRRHYVPWRREPPLPQRPPSTRSAAPQGACGRLWGAAEAVGGDGLELQQGGGRRVG